MACVGRGRGLLRYLQRVGAGPGCPLSGGSSPSSILPLGPSADTVWKATRGVDGGGSIASGVTVDRRVSPGT